ncbi:MAG: ATP-binding protein [Candidatus Doudnabacteria bacterium]|nr:ATP-binding protein [Candidatus Doudnabacteria bacterium]
MKARTLSQIIKKAARTFPAIVVTGPRQSGKTTLLKALFLNRAKYINLEDPEVRAKIKADPRQFLAHNHPPLILDEIQYVPELLIYVKEQIDLRRKPGQWLLTGSQNFVLMKNLSESLAGRVAVLHLLPFSLAERLGLGEKSASVENWLKLSPDRLPVKKPLTSLAKVLIRGSYPELALSRKLEPEIWCSSYINTYLERDVRSIEQVGDLFLFETFLRLCAIRTGQILNLSELARDTGISVATAKRWLSVLIASYQVLLIPPYYRNLGKRLIKSPKLYFTDTGLAAYLLRLQNEEVLLGGLAFPALFETLVVTDFWKRFMHHGQQPSLYYFRTRDGLEIDLVIELGGRLHLLEIKSSATITPHHAASLLKVQKSFESISGRMGIISQAKSDFLVKGVYNYNWYDALIN